MTRVSPVVSTTTKLSDEIDRRLTESAGYDSLVQVHCPGRVSDDSPADNCPRPSCSRYTSPCLASTPRISFTSCRPNDSVAVNGSSNAAHLTWSTRMWRLSGSISARSGDASKKYDGLRTTNWSSGALLATSTAADRLVRRPARPARCHVAAIVPG